MVPGFWPNLKVMEVDFTLEQEAQLAARAAKAGTAPERFVTNVVARYLDAEARFLAAVEKMDGRLEAMFKV